MLEEKQEQQNKLHTKRYWVILGAIIGALVVGFFIFDAMKYQSTDDAYVETTTVSVSPKVAGQIVEVLVRDNQEVKAGDVVAVIGIDVILHQIGQFLVRLCNFRGQQLVGQHLGTEILGKDLADVQ